MANLGVLAIQKRLPIFLEFLPLIGNGGGVLGFRPEMTSQSIAPGEGLSGNLNEEERQYIEGLIAHAEAIGKTAVLADTRTVGRIAGMKAAFPGLHIFLYRNLFQQWCSYSEQAAGGNPAFINTIKRIIEQNTHIEFFDVLSKMFPIGESSTVSENYFLYFVLSHLYCYCDVAESADLMIDSNRLVLDHSYRQATENAIEDASGISLDLSSAINTTAFSLVDMGAPEELYDKLKAMTDLAIRRVARTEAGRAFANRALTDLVEEYGRSRFYTGRLVGFVAGPEGLLAERVRGAIERNGLFDERDRLGAERNDLLAELNRSASQKDKALRQLDHQSARQGDLEAEMVRLRGELEASESGQVRLRGELDALDGTIGGLQIERDGLASTLHDLQFASAQLQSQRTALAADRDRLASALHDQKVERVRLQADRDGLLVERNGLLAGHEKTRADLDQSLAARSRAATERERLIAEREDLKSRFASAERVLMRRREDERFFERRLNDRGAADSVYVRPLSQWERSWRLGAARRSARRRDWARAEWWYASILRHEPNAPSVLVQYGHSLKEQGEPALAAIAYGRAKSLLSGADPDLDNHLLHVLRSAGLAHEMRRADGSAVDP